MYTNIINNIIELEKVETFIDIKPYYVFLYPKSEDASNVIIVDGLPTYQSKKENLAFASVNLRLESYCIKQHCCYR